MEEHKDALLEIKGAARANSANCGVCQIIHEIAINGLEGTISSLSRGSSRPSFGGAVSGKFGGPKR